ncbi:peptide/nickel transport system permease protein [Gracilibacillus ureilyticus]|uniref:Peptide/nickel transport system permease protein n=1 Tax=Gracilibacillus ureilyticus TaxID=531814 RepID=A0A1H9PID1_9BACI|nr:ABC transporter permease [Gracilibacillus ureilyticus]SER47992.1 peptide/nickel transport system permease protein [Gracilibacillus ureilyticus]
MKKWTYLPVILLVLLYVISMLIDPDKISIQLEERNLPPGFSHLFGTDWLGRDMFLRTMKGIELSITVGLLTAVLSTIVSFLAAMLASMHKWLDRLISWLTDLFLSLPHLVTLILISFTLGGGFKGVVIGLVLTHWPSLTRVLRAEILQLKETKYVKISEKLGKGFWWQARHHYLPHLLPQMLVGFTLIFPHAILHEASITFLGFGLSPEQPAIGIILSEAMQYLSTGFWWLAFFPGLILLIIILLFQICAKAWKSYLEKDFSHENIVRD